MPSSALPSSELAIQRGARLLAEGRAGDAVRVLRSLVAEAPIYAAAHVLLAAALDADGQTDDALDVWHRAAFLTPSSPLVQRERQRLLRGDAPPPAQAEPSDGASAELVPDSAEAATLADPPASGDALEEPAPDLETADPVPEASAAPPDAAVPEPTDAAPGAADAQDASAPERELPAGAHVAPANELFTTEPPASAPHPRPEPALDAEPSHASDPPAGDPPADEPAPPRRAVPDWGDLSEAAVAVLPPEQPEAPPAPPQDPGGWEVLAETERAPSGPGTVAPSIVRPEDWDGTPGPTSAPLPGAPTAAATAVPPAADPPDSSSDRDPAAPVAPSDAPPAPGAPDEPALADDLDALIESLETAPRITPDPDFEAPLPDLDGKVDDLASETLAQIYAAQHQYVEAAVVYERLAARAPEQAAALLERAAEMRRHADS